MFTVTAVFNEDGDLTKVHPNPNERCNLDQVKRKNKRRLKLANLYWAIWGLLDGHAPRGNFDEEQKAINALVCRNCGK